MKKLLATALAVLLSLGVAWAQKGLPQFAVPYSGGGGTVGWLSVGPCAGLSNVIGWPNGSGAAPGCTAGGGGGGGISSIINQVTPTSGFNNGDIIGSLSGTVYDTLVQWTNLGTVTSISFGCGGNTTFGPVTSTGTAYLQDLIATGAPFSAASLTIQSTYCGGTAKYTNTGPSVVTLPTLGVPNVPVGWYLDNCTYNTGTVTLTAAGGQTIAGAGTFPLPAATATNPYCARIIVTSSTTWDVKFVTPTLAVSNITVGTTGINSGINGNCLGTGGGLLANIACLTALSSATPTVGITNNHLLAANANFVIDSGILISNVPLLSGNQTFSGSNTFSGTVNNTGTWQKNGNTMTFPGSTATLASLNVTQTFTNQNTFSGVTIFSGTLQVKLRNVSGSVTVSATTDYFLCVDTSGGTATINLPSTPATGLTYLVKDCVGNAGTNSITIDPSGGTLIDGAATAVMNQNFQSNSVTYNGTQWSIN